MVLLNCKTSFIDITGAGDVGDFIETWCSGDWQYGLGIGAGIEDIVPDFAGRKVGNSQSYVSLVGGNSRYNASYYAIIMTSDWFFNKTPCKMFTWF